MSENDPNILFKKRIWLPEDAHWLERMEAHHFGRIISGNAKLDEWSLEDYFVWSFDKSKLVVILALDNRPVSIMMLTVDHPSPSIITLDVVATEKKYQNLGFGGRMVDLACSIGRDLGMKEVRLDAMSEELRDWYRDDSGFEEFGTPFVDPDFGRLIPMRKVLP